MCFSANRFRGFTLIELLVAVTIISVVSLIGYASLGPLKEEKTFKNTALDLQTFIKTVQTNAASQVKCKSNESAAKWAVVFDNANAAVSMFCDDALSSELSVCKNAKDWALNKKIELKKVNSNVEIAAIKGDDDKDPTGDVIVCFSALNGNIEFSDNIETGLFKTAKSIKITLKNQKTAAISEVLISKGGSVDVK